MLSLSCFSDYRSKRNERRQSIPELVSHAGPEAPAQRARICDATLRRGGRAPEVTWLTLSIN